jgi:hypothetical protein
MDEDDVGEQSPTKAEPNASDERVYDGAPITAVAPPLHPRPDVPKERFQGAEWIFSRLAAAAARDSSCRTHSLSIAGTARMVFTWQRVTVCGR